MQWRQLARGTLAAKPPSGPHALQASLRRLEFLERGTAEIAFRHLHLGALLVITDAPAAPQLRQRGKAMMLIATNDVGMAGRTVRQSPPRPRRQLSERPTEPGRATDDGPLDLG